MADLNHGVVITLLTPISVEDTGRLTQLLGEIGASYAIGAEVFPWRTPDGRTPKDAPTDG